MVSPPARLISGTDWLVCGIGSIVIHTLSVQYLPWSDAIPPLIDRAPVAIEMVILPEESSTADLSALNAIPLDLIPEDPIPDSETAEAIEPIDPIPDSDPVNSQTNPNLENPSPANPPPPVIPLIPRPANSSLREQSQPSVLTGNNLSIPLDLPLTPSFDPDRLESDLGDGDPALESDLLSPDFSLNSLPSNPSGDQTQPSLPTDPIEGVAIVAANPNALEFRVTVQSVTGAMGSEAIESETNSANTPQDTPRPRRQRLILTANPQVRGCTVPTLEALRSNGETIILSLAIDAQGSVLGDRTLVKQSNAHPDYNQWAMCLLQDWPFSPGKNNPSGNPVVTQVSVQIEVLSSSAL